MTELSRKIIDQHLVRKTGKQKKEFREMLIKELMSMGIEAREEKHRDLFGSVNVIAGDAEKAEIIFGAHYDTCPRMILPNFITPRNLALFILYQLLMVGILVLAALAVSIPLAAAVSETVGEAVWFLVYFGLLALMMKGPANPKTMNDNTSGIVGLIELIARMPEETRARCAFVFFDNEELGMLGSSAFRKARKKRMQQIPLVNLDCIGDGEYLLLAASKAFRQEQRLYGALREAFAAQGPVLDVKGETTVYPSDQQGFKKSLAIAALKKRPVVGYYMDRIHTAKDTVLREENIERVAAGLCGMTGKYLREG